MLTATEPAFALLDRREPAADVFADQAIEAPEFVFTAGTPPLPGVLDQPHPFETRGLDRPNGLQDRKKQIHC